MQVWPDLAANPLNHPTTNCFVFINSAYSWRDTGDLVYVEDRRIVYMGRKDNQFKVHGKRLMLEAIESELSSLPHVVQCKYVRTCSRFYLRLACSRLDLTWRCVQSRVVYDKRDMLSASASLRAFVVLDEPIDDEGTYPHVRDCAHTEWPLTLGDVAGSFWAKYAATLEEWRRLLIVNLEDVARPDEVHVVYPRLPITANAKVPP